MACAYLPRILPGRAPCLCNFDVTTTKTNNKNDTQTQAPKPHTYQPPHALGRSYGGFKHGIMSSSHFQILRGIARVMQPLCHMSGGAETLLFGEGATLAKPSCHTFVVNLWRGGEILIYRHIQDSFSCFFHLGYHGVIPHKPPGYI